MSERKGTILVTSPPKPIKSEEFVSKLLKPTRISRLPKCTQQSPTKVSTNTSQEFENLDQIDDEMTLDFTTRMKMKNKISDLQQVNNELKFKLTSMEAKLKTKDSEVITADSLNKQLKNLLDKHMNREHELDSQIINLEKKILKLNKQVADMEEDKNEFLAKKKEIENVKLENEEFYANLRLKDAQILDLSVQIAEVKRSLSQSSMKNEILERQLNEMKRIKPMLDVRGNYINVLEEKIRYLEQLCSHLNQENCKVQSSLKSLENFRFHSLLATMDKTTDLLQIS